MNIQALVQEFHETFGHPVALTPGLIPKERAAFRVSLIEEELQELKDAIEAGDLVEIADALGDLEVVVNGTALEYGIRMPEVVREIHASNMSKLGEDGEPIYREDGKILKGANFWHPRIDVVLEGQGWLND